MKPGISTFRIAKLVAMGAVALLLAPRPAAADDVEDVALPVPKLTIYPGDSIEADKLLDRLFIARTVSHGVVFETRDLLLGKVASKTLLPGKPIPVNAVREPFAVGQGKSAWLVFESDGLVIRSAATALQNGSVGEVISARNVDSGLIIRGTVQADGTVRVD